jgi:outer membrane protein, multidrug efflux system
MRRGSIISFVLVCMVVGCTAVGPNYQRNDPAVPAAFGSLESGVTTGEAAEREFLRSWWKILQDPILNSLMERAVNGNLELRIAQARVRQTRALSLVSSSRLLPEGGLTGTYERIRLTEPASIQGDRQNNLFSAEFDAAWEIDLFGGLRRGTEAAEADLFASGDALRDTLVTLQGEVGRNYIGYRTYQLRLDIARQTIRIRRENAEITAARARAGFVSELDLVRSRGELASAESKLPFLENSLLVTLHRLGILLGLEPMSLTAELQTPAELPAIPENLPAGLPSDLLRRRPDIRRAEREIAAATARIGVSTAELFPKFSLTGTFGFRAMNVGSLYQDSSSFWNIGPSVHWPILNFKRILATIEFTKAVQEETLARYERTVLLSLEEAENSLVNLSREKRRIEALTEAVRSNELAVKLATERYVAGLETYLAVTDAQSALYIAQDDLAQSRQNHVLGFVSLYKALGGGWLDTYGVEDPVPSKTP